jgi:hypothetical protein
LVLSWIGLAIQQSYEAAPVLGGHPRVLPNVLPSSEMAPISLKVLLNIAAILEAVHNVGKFRSVAQAERVSGLVKAGEIDYGFT